MSLARARTRSAPSSASSSPRTGWAMPEARESGALSTAGTEAGGALIWRSSSPIGPLEERHPGLDRDFDQLRLRRGDRGRQRVPDLVAAARPPGADPVGGGDRGDVQLG